MIGRVPLSATAVDAVLAATPLKCLFPLLQVPQVIHLSVKDTYYAHLSI